MQQLANLIILPRRLGADPLLKLGPSLVQLGVRREGDGNERVKLLLDKRVELLSGGVEDIERRGKDGGVDIPTGWRRDVGEDGAEEGVLGL